MASLLKLKKSSVSGKAPLASDLDYGELAINYADGLIFYKTSGNVVGSLGAQGAQGTVGPLGPMGDPGIQGTQGTQGIQGRQFTWRGEWEAGTLYTKDHVVSHEGNSFVAVYTSEFNGNLTIPLLGQSYPKSVNTTYWNKMTEQGLQGLQGATGSQGPVGTIGATGDVGPTGLTGSQGVQGVQGDVGTQGVQGTQGVSIQGTQGTSIQGAIGPQGSVGQSLIIRGNWNSVDQYQVNDIVLYNGSSWAALIPNQGNYPPDSSPSQWALIASGSTLMEVSLIDSSQTTSQTITNVTALRFDTDSGFDVTDLGSGAVKVAMNSTFKTWQVDGQSDLIASGLDTIEFVAGSGIQITTDPNTTPKSITFSAVQGAQGIEGSQGEQGSQGIIGAQGTAGQGFKIAKSYASVALLTADINPTNIIAGEFAIIETGDNNNSENSRLYLWNGSSYSYQTDLSGAVGIQGVDGLQGIQGVYGDTGSQGAIGIQGIQGNAGVIGYDGAQGPVGLQGIQGIIGDQGVQGLVGGDPSWSVINTNTTASSFGRYLTNSQSSSFTITLPASPAVGDYIQIADIGYWTLNNVTVLRNGNLIEGQSEDLILDASGTQVEFVYNSDGWHFTTSLGKRGVQGIQGTIGSQGIEGSQGVTGATGSQGTQGIQGFGYEQNQGIQGTTGAGTQGIQGIQGIQGTQGTTGSGSQGIQGIQGGVISQEPLSLLTASTGVVAHNTTLNSVWTHSSISANFTVNFTNVSTTNNSILTFLVILLQGATARSISAVQIDGVAQTINWFDNIVPTAVANKKEFYNFSLLRTSNAWTVLGSMTSFG